MLGVSTQPLFPSPYSQEQKKAMPSAPPRWAQSFSHRAGWFLSLRAGHLLSLCWLAFCFLYQQIPLL